ncbi:MAG: methyl-accepting chemotaxis protein, partial [Desulfobacterales bacterium]|nr:methyl-accepting chemotaxis protein [Desulfobacterales bacterium]
GAGFAVVADEVRNLAQRAAGAASDTTTLIEEIRTKIKDGSTMLDNTGEAFSGVVEITESVHSLVAEIAEASNQQDNGVKQINGAVNQMDEVTRQTASTAEESAASVQELSAQAMQMKAMVDRMVSLIGANGSNGATRNVPNSSRSAAGLPSNPALPAGVKSLPAGKEVSPNEVFSIKKTAFQEF